MTAESLPRQSKFCYTAAANSCPLSPPPPHPQFPFPHLGSHWVLSFLPLHHPLFTPRPRWHLPGALAFSQGSPCCSARVWARGFMVHIHQHHMPGFMGDGVQTWLLWISLAEADLWAVVGYNGWASFPPTPTSIHSRLLRPLLPSAIRYIPQSIAHPSAVTSVLSRTPVCRPWSFI